MEGDQTLLPVPHPTNALTLVPRNGRKADAAVQLPRHEISLAVRMLPAGTLRTWLQ